MALVTRNQSENFFENYSKGWFSSFRFKRTDSDYCFTPSLAVSVFVSFFYVAALFVPHLIYYMGHYSSVPSTNLLLYLFVVVLCLSCVVVLVIASPLRDVYIDKVLKQVEIRYKDPIGRFIKKTQVIGFSEIEKIEHRKVSTRSGTDYPIHIKRHDGSSVLAITIGSESDVPAVKAYFEALIRDSFEAGNIEPKESELEKTIKKSLAEKDGETSYMPFITLIIAALSLFIGFILFMVLGKMRSFTALVDGMRPVTLQWVGITFGVYAIPLLIGAFSRYQRRNKKSRQTILVLGTMGFVGLYLCCSGVAHWANVAFDKQIPSMVKATVTDTYYSPGSKGRSGEWVIVLNIPDVVQRIEISHHDDTYTAPVNSELMVELHPGYLGKRWIRLNEKN